MRRRTLRAAVLVAVGALVVGGARANALGSFSPAAAAERSGASSTAQTGRESLGQDAAFLAVRAEPPADPTQRSAGTPQETAGATTTPSSEASATPSERQTSSPARTLVPAPTPARTLAPTPTPTVRVAPVTASPVPTAAACNPGSWFCYPRLGISGAIVPYTDCSGSTDVGTQIRSFSCLSDRYLMAHAYTQFGKLTGWQAGDLVIAYGQQFTVTGAFVQSSCTQPRLPLAPLEMQTSLTPNACGDVLVVQAR